MGGAGSSDGGSSPSGGSSTGGSTSGGAASGGIASGGQGNGIEFPFDSDTDGFAVTYEEGLGLSGSFASTLEHDATKGSPAPGSLKLSGPTDDQEQKVFVGHNPETALDLTGKVLSAKLQLASGLGTNEECPGGTYVYAKSGNDFKGFARGSLAEPIRKR